MSAILSLIFKRNMVQKAIFFILDFTPTMKITLLLEKPKKLSTQLMPNYREKGLNSKSGVKFTTNKIAFYPIFLSKIQESGADIVYFHFLNRFYFNFSEPRLKYSKRQKIAQKTPNCASIQTKTTSSCPICRVFFTYIYTYFEKWISCSFTNQQIIECQKP